MTQVDGGSSMTGLGKSRIFFGWKTLRLVGGDWNHGWDVVYILLISVNIWLILMVMIWLMMINNLVLVGGDWNHGILYFPQELGWWSNLTNSMIFRRDLNHQPEEFWEKNVGLTRFSKVWKGESRLKARNCRCCSAWWQSWGQLVLQEKETVE